MDYRVAGFANGGGGQDWRRWSIGVLGEQMKRYPRISRQAAREVARRDPGVTKRKAGVVAFAA